MADENSPNLSVGASLCMLNPPSVMMGDFEHTPVSGVLNTVFTTDIQLNSNATEGRRLLESTSYQRRLRDAKKIKQLGNGVSGSYVHHCKRVLLTIFECYSSIKIGEEYELRVRLHSLKFFRIGCHVEISG